MVSVKIFWYGMALVLGAVVLAYSNSFAGVFFFDDSIAIVENPTIRSFGDSFFPDRGLPVSGRPGVNVSFALNYALGGLEPKGYHLFNLGIHLANTLLIALIAKNLLRQHCPLNEAFALALGIASVWALHPLNTETIDYVTQRTELLVTYFALVAVWSTTRYWETESRWWNALGIAACFAGLLMKESAAMIPLIVPLVDRVATSSTWRMLFARRAKVYLAYGASWIVLIAILMTSPRSDSVGTQLGISPFEYLSTQCWVIPRYLSQVFWPTGLCVDYGTDIVPLSKSWPGGFLLVFLFAVAGWGIVRAPGVGLLLGSFFIWLAPTSSFLPIITEVGAERRMYLPLVSLVAFTLLAVGKVLPAKHRAAILLIISLAVSILVGDLTYQRNVVYHSEITIWQDAIAKMPNNFRAHYNLAVALNDNGHPAEAINNYRIAIAKMTHDRLLSRARTLSQLAGILCNQGNNAEALALVEEALASTIPTSETHVNIAVVLAKLGKLPEAEEQLVKAIEINPQNAIAQANYGTVLAAQGRRSLAEKHFTRALKIDPQLAEAKFGLAMLSSPSQPSVPTPGVETASSAAGWIRLGTQARTAGDTKKAIECYEQAIRLEPANAFALNSLGAILARIDLNRAMELYEKAIEADPTFVEAYSNLGTGLARAGRLTDAILQFEAALQLNPDFQPAQKNLEVVRQMLKDQKQ